MVRKEVIEYVDSFVCQGYPYEYVRHQLVQRGYSQEELEELDRIFIERKAPIILKKLAFVLLIVIGIGAVIASAYFLYPILKPCHEQWSCSDWNPDVCPESEQQTRMCTDANACGKVKEKPAESQSCTYICVEDWQCEDWSACSDDGSQERTCSDGNSCGTTNNLPIVQQSCTPPCHENWECTPWFPSGCLNGTLTRTCTDTHTCNTLMEKPDEWKICELCVPNWKCDDWGKCKNGQRKRYCKDKNNCGTLEGKPDDDESCDVVIQQNNNTNSS